MTSVGRAAGNLCAILIYFDAEEIIFAPQQNSLKHGDQAPRVVY